MDQTTSKYIQCRYCKQLASSVYKAHAPYNPTNADQITRAHAFNIFTCAAHAAETNMDADGTIWRTARIYQRRMQENQTQPYNTKELYTLPNGLTLYVEAKTFIYRVEAEPSPF